MLALDPKYYRANEWETTTESGLTISVTSIINGHLHHIKLIDHNRSENIMERSASDWPGNA